MKTIERTFPISEYRNLHDRAAAKGFRCVESTQKFMSRYAKEGSKHETLMCVWSNGEYKVICHFISIANKPAHKSWYSEAFS